MNCNIVKDLLPLYIDECCSEESEKAVEQHIKECAECKKIYDEMKTPTAVVTVSKAPVKFSRLNDWKASILQSVLLFLSFALITTGVALEASTPYNLLNGFWAYNLVIPSTGFMLSLANWYFVRVYKSKRSFSNFSCLFTFLITACGFVWAKFHYEGIVLGVFSGNNFSENMDNLLRMLLVLGIGIFLTFIFCSLSKVLSEEYAKMLGKE